MKKRWRLLGKTALALVLAAGMVLTPMAQPTEVEAASLNSLQQKQQELQQKQKENEEKIASLKRIPRSSGICEHAQGADSKRPGANRRFK